MAQIVYLKACVSFAAHFVSVLIGFVETNRMTRVLLGFPTLLRYVDAQADLSLRWAHSHFVGFVMRRLK